MRLIYMAMAYLMPLALYAQNIPDSRKVDWSICGVEGGIPCLTAERNAVTEFGIDNTGSSDVASAVNTALSNLNESEVLYFPSGTYLFNATVSVPQGVVIRGESPINTVLNFDFSANATCFMIEGSGASGNVLNVTDISVFGEYTVTVNDATGISIGDHVEIAQANDPAIHGAEDPADLTTWAEELKGQIAIVVAKNGNTLTLDRSLTFDYDLNFTTTLKKVSLISNVGLENFKLVRVSDNGTNALNNNFWFTYSQNCWMRRVHSEYSSRYHVRVDYSTNFEMSECFLDKAFNCGGGGAGYGVLIQDHATECLVENNIARALRHPWIPKEGAARNVYAYNFSSGTTQGTACDADPLTNSYADISLHGHYPSYNLFEGNIVYRVTSSDSWGPNGPGNTIFRNRVLGANGIWIQSYSKEQNVIGNELTYPGADFEMDRDGTIGGTTLNYSNYGTTGLIDGEAPQSVLNSYYLSSKPDFFNGDPWPSIGPGVVFNSGEIPAQKRFNSGNYFYDPSASECVITSFAERKNTVSFAAYPNPFSEDFVIELPESGTISIVDATGRIIDVIEVQAGVNHIKTGNESGLYQLIYRNSKGQGVVRLMKR